MPSKSPEEENFFRVTAAIKAGKIKGYGAAKKAAKEMTKKQIGEFAKHIKKDRPTKKIKEGLNFKCFFDL